MSNCENESFSGTIESLVREFLSTDQGMAYVMRSIMEPEILVNEYRSNYWQKVRETFGKGE